MTKKLYKWKSAAMADYFDGDIVVMADSVETARVAATAFYEKYLVDRYQYYFDEQGGFVGDQEDAYDLEDARRIFQEDLADDPHEAIDGVILIRGSS